MLFLISIGLQNSLALYNRWFDNVQVLMGFIDLMLEAYGLYRLIMR